jgi:hypothetical protein
MGPLRGRGPKHQPQRRLDPPDSLRGAWPGLGIWAPVVSRAVRITSVSGFGPDNIFAQPGAGYGRPAGLLDNAAPPTYPSAVAVGG